MVANPYGWRYHILESHRKRENKLLLTLKPGLWSKSNNTCVWDTCYWKTLAIFSLIVLWTLPKFLPPFSSPCCHQPYLQIFPFSPPLPFHSLSQFHTVKYWSFVHIQYSSLGCPLWVSQVWFSFHDLSSYAHQWIWSNSIKTHKKVRFSSVCFDVNKGYGIKILILKWVSATILAKQGTLQEITGCPKVWCLGRDLVLKTLVPH